MKRAARIVCAGLIAALLGTPGIAAGADLTLTRTALTTSDAFPGGSGSRVSLSEVDGKTLTIPYLSDTLVIPYRTGGATFVYSCEDGEPIPYNLGGAVPGSGVFSPAEPMLGGYGAMVVVGGTLVGASGWHGFWTAYLDKQNVTSRYHTSSTAYGTSWTASTATASFNGSGQDFRAVGVTQLWGGATYPADTPLYTDRVRKQWASVVAWVPDGAGKVSVRQMNYTSYGAEAWGGIIQSRTDAAITKLDTTGWTPQTTIGGWRALNPRWWDASAQLSKSPTTGQMPFAGEAYASAVFASGVTTDTATVQAIYDGAITWGSSMTSQTALVDLQAPESQETTTGDAPMDDFTGGAWHEWISKTVDTVTGNVTGVVGSLFWWLDAIGEWGAE